VARSVVELIVDAAKAINPLKRVTAETKKLEGAVKDANGRLRDAKGRFIGVGNAAKKASGGVNSLSTAVKGLFVGLSAIEAAKFVFFKTAELQTQTRSLKVLTGSLEDAEAIIKSLQGFAAITPFTSAELIDTAKRLKAFGFETEELVGIVSRLGDIAGATGADLGGIATAFGQIQAKGRLQGEELLQLQERGVDLQGTLRKEYGLTKEEFKKALESGRINAEAVSFALRKLTDEGGKYANGAIAQSDTLSGRFSTLVDNISAIARRVGEVLTPAVDGLLKSLNESLAAFNALIAVSGGAALTQANIKLALPGGDAQDLLEIAGVLKALPKDPANKELAAQLKTIGRNQTDVIANFGILMREAGRELPESYQTALDAAKDLLSIRVKLTKAAGDRPDLDDPSQPSGGKPKTPAETARERAIQTIASLKEEAVIARGMTNQEKNMLRLKQEISKAEENRALVGDDLTNQLIEQLQVTFGTKEVAQALLDLKQRQKQAETDAGKAAQDALKVQQAEAQRLEQLFGGIGQTISTGIVDALMNAQNATQALGGMLEQVGKQLLQLGINTLLKTAFPGSGLFSGLLGFANGGRPPVGRPSVVGERGPELFVPDRAGTILPNGVGMGSTTITVNVDASETSADASSGSGAQLGKAIGLAVQQELLKQKRPGGLLAGV
tara:strand:+ start:10750 stop:12762 length:2013 start_codon:yes stop_codon:yes gene_type:complete